MNISAISRRTRDDARRRWSRGTIAAFTLVLVAHLATIWFFHDRFWYPTDDGFYAHVAERVLAGEVLHRDVQDIRPAFIHAIHALTFRIAGVDMVVLRYPLMAVSLAQVAFAFALLARHGALVGLVGAAAASALGVVQFFNPNPNWYCLSVATALTWWMARTPPDTRGRLVVAGVLLGLITGLRHLTGVWAAMGLLTVVLLELQDGATGRDTIVGRVLAFVMLTGMVAYTALIAGMGAGGLLCIATTPLVLLATLVVRCGASNQRTVRAVASVAVGCAAVLLPLALYYARHGALTMALADLLLSAVGETRLAFFQTISWYLVFPLMGLVQLAALSDPVSVANGVYWMALPLAPLVNGILVLQHLRQRRSVSDIVPGVIAAFYGMVSVMIESPFFLYYSIGLTLNAVLWSAGSGPAAIRYGATAVVGLVAAVAMACHAGQPPERTPVDMLRGTRQPIVTRARLTGARASFTLPVQQVADYNRLVAAIQAHVRRDGTMLAVPNDAELYFLARRANVSRFYNSALGLQTRQAVQALVRTFVERPPDMVIYRRGDKYDTEYLQDLMSVVRERYELQDVIAGRELWVRRSRGADRR